MTSSLEKSQRRRVATKLESVGDVFQYLRDRQNTAISHYLLNIVKNQSPFIPSAVHGVACKASLAAVFGRLWPVTIDCNRPEADIRGVLNACSGELSFRSEHLHPPSINLLSLAATRDSAAMACHGGYWQPMFSVLPRRFLSGLVHGWNAGERSLQKALSCEYVAGLECPDGDTR